MSKNEKSAYFRHIFANNFFGAFFDPYTHIEFEKKNFLLLLTLFLNFECKCAQNGSKKWKLLFYKRVLEFN